MVVAFASRFFIEAMTDGTSACMLPSVLPISVVRFWMKVSSVFSLSMTDSSLIFVAKSEDLTSHRNANTHSSIRSYGRAMYGFNPLKPLKDTMYRCSFQVDFRCL